VRFVPELPDATPYLAIREGDDLLVLRNPRSTASLPTWLQQYLVNGVLAAGSAPRPQRRKAGDNVIDLAIHPSWGEYIKRQVCEADDAAHTGRQR
jgi:hypothetical protein